jgi:hypothetical protein
MRAIALAVAVIGVFILAIGVVFIVQAGSAEQKVEESLQTGLSPIGLGDVEAAYDKASDTMVQMKPGELQQVAAGKSVSDNYLKVVNQRTGYGLTRTNIGLAQFTRISGILNVVLGVSLVLIGLALLSRRPQPALA